MIFGLNPTRDISKLSQIYNNFEISPVVFMPNITTNHAITYTNVSTLNVYYKIDQFCLVFYFNRVQQDPEEDRVSKDPRVHPVTQDLRAARW